MGANVRVRTFLDFDRDTDSAVPRSKLFSYDEINDELTTHNVLSAPVSSPVSVPMAISTSLCPDTAVAL